MVLQNPTFEQLEDSVSSNLTPSERELVRKAYEIAAAAHDGQRRDEGSPYIDHPIRVASSLVNELEIHSSKLICAALMHDVIEDSDTTRSEIADIFGEEIADVVWLLTKLEGVSLSEYLRAIEDAAETGAPIVKLCDRLDNLRYLIHSPKVEKKHRYIRTTEVYYLPMARRTNRYLYQEIAVTLEQIREHVRTLR
jgi:guanosine-3',5'-bis(diphosphate) 3'-pyrophosphohydrolase